METFKKIFTYAFTVDFLLKILLITVILSIWTDGLPIRVAVSNRWGAFDVALTQPVTIKSESDGFQLKN